MVRIHSKEKIKNLKDARRQGKSIEELMREFSLPKSTVWHHIHTIKLTEKQKVINRLKQGGSKLRSERNWENAKNESKKILQNKENRHLLSLAAALYWAEGNKKGFVFTNTDVKMIKLFIKILENEFKIKKDRIKITIRIFSNLNRNECIRFWKKNLEIRKNDITVYMNDGGTKGKAHYGICRLTVKNGGNLKKLITSLICDIYNEVLNPRSSTDESSPVLRER